MAGPNIIRQVQTYGKTLPRPTIIEAAISQTSGTAIKLTWNLPNDTKKRSFTYGVYYGVNMVEMLTGGQRINTTKTTVTVKDLHACESYSFVVAIVGPAGSASGPYGPPSTPVEKSTKYNPGAPPKNLKVCPTYSTWT